MNKLFVICERDAGLFSLIQQVIANIPKASADGFTPIVYFARNCCYWVEHGYQDADNVWEYYFQPLVAGHDCAMIPQTTKNMIRKTLLESHSIDFAINVNTYVSNQFGYPSRSRGKALQIPFTWDDPDGNLRDRASDIVNRYIRPRPYLKDKVAAFYRQQLQGSTVIGVHMRGTDAVSSSEQRLFRHNSLVPDRYIGKIKDLLRQLPQAKIFVATDDENSLRLIRENFADRVVSYDSIRHQQGDVVGHGPSGAPLPGYIANDPQIAARNGEEAIVEYLLLCRCDYLVHNGASLARTVLLSVAHLDHYNTHRKSLSVYFRVFRVSYLIYLLRCIYRYFRGKLRYRLIARSFR